MPIVKLTAKAGPDPSVIEPSNWNTGDYHADQVDGFDYDIGAVLVRAALATGEEQLAELLQSWKLSPGQFIYPWQTGDPK